LQKKADIRNNHVHGVFGYVDDKPEQRVRHSFKPKGHRVNPGFERISEASLKKMADDAQALWNRAEDLSNRIKDLRKKQKALKQK
jgi:hypothetical protein